MKEETLNEIDRYLLGEMTGSERTDFEQRLANSPALRQELEQVKDIIDAVETRAMKEHLEQLDQARRRRKKRYRMVLVLSATAACLLLGIFLIRGGKSSDVSSLPFDSSFYLLNPEGGGERSAPFTKGIETCMEAHQYKKALAVIDSLVVAFQEDKSTLQAKELLTEEEAYKLESTTKALYELEWYRIWALVGDKKYKEAREWLERYRLQEGACQEKADSLWLWLEKQ